MSEKKQNFPGKGERLVYQTRAETDFLELEAELKKIEYNDSSKK